MSEAEDLKNSGTITQEKNTEYQEEQENQKEKEKEENLNTKQNNKVDAISYDVEQRLIQLEESCQGQNQEQVLQIRIDMLSISKILVFTHGKSQFLLTQAHTNLGEAYMNFDSYEQSIFHLMIAQKKNAKLLSHMEEAKVQTLVILKLLGKCYEKMENYNDALEYLDNACETAKQNETQFDPEVLMLLATCHNKLGNQNQAFQEIKQVLEIYDQKYGADSNDHAIAKVHIAQIYAQKNAFEQAIENMNYAINTLETNNYDQQEYIASLYQSLSDYYSNEEQIDQQIKCLNKVKNISVDIYGPEHINVIKVKRSISINLLKMERHEEALQELLETEDLEMRQFGEFSFEVAKTQKIIGTLFILTQQYQEAQKYLGQALKIFDDNGMNKAVSEIRTKLRLAKECQDKNNQ